ncbi:MAG: hypothetical protein MMC33_003764 [Icmadophila ericetorum]|nr:hypothetical protein [Icmadophila ericetorum]
MAVSPLSSSTVQLTQNTAPVFEFRCLYTRDIRKKKRQFHDGVLRYHTFNKRIMLYDVEMNYIGGGHRSGTEAVMEGCEFELDKGFIVQVEEPTGITETDLTGLLDRKKEATARNVRAVHKGSPESATSPSPGYFAPTARSVGANVPLAPKTLNNILGTLRGKYGRAMLPPKSPYEERYIIEGRYQGENRPAKRQKLDTGPVHNVGAVSGYGTREQGTIRPNVVRAPALVPQSHAIADAQISLNKLGPTNTSKCLPQQSNNPAVNTSTGLSDYEFQCLPAKPKKTLNDRSCSEQAISDIGLRDQSPQRATNLPRPATEKEKQHEVMNALRFASNKPRRKLMCRDLLPSLKDSYPSPLKERRNAPSDLGPVRKRRKGKPLKESSKISEGQEAPPNHRSNPRSMKKSKGPELSSSPAFETLEDPGDEFADLDQFNLDQYNPDWDGPIEISDAEENISLIAESPLKTPQNRLTKMRVSPTPASKVLELSQLDQILLSRPSPIHQTNPKSPNVLPDTSPKSSSPAPKPLFFSNAPVALASKHSIPEPTKQNHVSRTSPPTGRPPYSFQQLQPQPQPQTRRPSLKKPLQKSRSDERPKMQPPTLKKTVLDPTCLEKAKDEDRGPWSREVFDLFGWEKGMEKDMSVKAKLAVV